jgi:glycosyltransferase involved in cell wall biosynthesis
MPDSEEPNAIRVSVIIPAYNCADTIAATLDSVLGQSFPPQWTEVIVIDDGSTDASPDIVRSFAPRFRHLSVHRLEHAGPYRSRNHAIGLARGDYIAFLDADDVWAPEKLSKQVAVLDGRPDVGLVHTGVTHIDGAGQILRTRAPANRYAGDCFEALIVRNGVTTSSVVVRRSLLEQAGGFDEAFTACGDWELWTRLARQTRFVILPEPLTHYREHMHNITASTARVRRYEQAIIVKHERVYGREDARLMRCVVEARAEMHQRYGQRYLVAGDLDAARIELGEALKLRRLRLSVYRDLLKCHLRRGILARTRPLDPPPSPVR